MKRQLLAALAVLAAGCGDGGTDPTSADVARGFLPCVFGSQAAMQVGETRTYEGAEAGTLCLQAGAGGAEYTLVPFLAEPDGEARLEVEAIGGNLTAPLGPPNPARLPAASAGPRPDHARHQQLMERMRGVTAPRLHAARGANRSIEAAPGPLAAAVPTAGSNITIRIPQFYLNQDPCSAGVIRQARVAAVTDRAILVNDVANPAGGLSDAELLAFGREFDRQIYPLDTQYFGTPTDLDANGRVIIVFTREVNALTPPSSGGYVGGFFFSGDLFPLQATSRQDACPRSNVGEIFYLLAPDPGGAINGNPRSRELILQSAAGTIAHEFQHLINASRRIFVNDAEEFEEVWLDEALSHSAEEINFYAASGLSPRRNLTVQQISAPAVSAAVDKYMLENFGRYLTYLEAPDSNSVIGPDLLETRGGSWAFLRYAADRKATGDQPFFFALANNTRTGIDNLSQVIGADGLDWVQDWTMAVYTDDAVPGVDPVRFQQPSWNFRDIMPIVSDLYGGPEVFPLKVHLLGSSSDAVKLRGGGAAYLRFGIGAQARVGVRLTSGDGVPSDALRFTLVRTR